MARAAGKPFSERVTLAVDGVAAPDEVALSPSSPTLVMPIESAVVVLVERGSETPLDRSSFALLPPGSRAKVRPHGTVASFATLGFSADACRRMVETHARIGVTQAKLDAWFGARSILPRTVWVHEIVHRYVFERHALDEHHSEAARFLETEIIKEVYFLLRDRDEGADRATIQQQHSAQVAKVIAFIDAHVFEWRTVKDLAKVAGTSESSLLRAFRREVGAPPGAYWRARKLDAALDLLRAGTRSVAEVAERVGYENPTAFGDAFRRRFGRAPSSFRPRSSIRPAP